MHRTSLTITSLVKINMHDCYITANNSGRAYSPFYSPSLSKPQTKTTPMLGGQTMQQQWGVWMHAVETKNDIRLKRYCTCMVGAGGLPSLQGLLNLVPINGSLRRIIYGSLHLISQTGSMYQGYIFRDFGFCIFFFFFLLFFSPFFLLFFSSFSFLQFTYNSPQVWCQSLQWLVHYNCGGL